MDNLGNKLLVIYRVGRKIIHAALLNGSDCANGITIKPLNIKTVLISLGRGRLVLVYMCLICLCATRWRRQGMLKLKMRSNLVIFVPQKWHNELIRVKFGMEECTIGLPSHAKFGDCWVKRMGTSTHKIQNLWSNLWSSVPQDDRIYQSS